jgi:hypothetical protein
MNYAWINIPFIGKRRGEATCFCVVVIQVWLFQGLQQKIDPHYTVFSQNFSSSACFFPTRIGKRVVIFLFIYALTGEFPSLSRN